MKDELALVASAVERDCSRRAPRRERIDTNGPFELWRSTSESDQVDRYVVAGARDGCDLVLRAVAMFSDGERSSSAPRLFYARDIIMESGGSSSPFSDVLPDWRLRYLASDELEATLASRVAATCPEPLPPWSIETDDNACARTIAAWIEGHTTIVGFKPPGATSDTWIDVVDSVAYWDGQATQ